MELKQIVMKKQPDNSKPVVIVNGSKPVVQSNEIKKRMVLSAITEASSDTPEKILIYGPEGIGKSTWAANFEKPIFISAEDGLKGVKPAPMMFPEAKSWQDILDAVDELITQPHEYKTLVIDTIDWVEAMAQQFVIRKHGKESIEDWGYKGGYTKASEEIFKLVNLLNVLRAKKKIDIVLLAHSAIVTFKNPDGQNYDKFNMKLYKDSIAKLKEWSDVIFFANHEVLVDSKDPQKMDQKGKAYSGDIIIHAKHTAIFDAKNRYGIDKPIKLDPKKPETLYNVIKEAR